MKSFGERNRLAIGAVGIVAITAMVVAALQYQNLPFLDQGKTVSAYFADAGGLRTDNTVEVSGYPVGKVSSIELDGPGVRVTFNVDDNIRMGNRTEVAIKTKGLLGSKFLDVIPRGEGRLEGPIPIDRTTSPYQLPDALGDLATTISGLNTNRLSESLDTMAQTFADTPADFRNALKGVARLAQTLDERDAQLRGLLDNAAKATGVLAKRTDEIVTLVHDTNAVLAQLRTQSSALDQIWTNISTVSQPAPQIQPRVHLLPAGHQVVSRQRRLFGVGWCRRSHAATRRSAVVGQRPVRLSGQRAAGRGQRRSRWKAGVRITA